VSVAVPVSGQLSVGSCQFKKPSMDGVESGFRWVSARFLRNCAAACAKISMTWKA
jgi:hypothetical protein